MLYLSEKWIKPPKKYTHEDYKMDMERLIIKMNLAPNYYWPPPHSHKWTYKYWKKTFESKINSV